MQNLKLNTIQVADSSSVFQQECTRYYPLHQHKQNAFCLFRRLCLSSVSQGAPSADYFSRPRLYLHHINDDIKLISLYSAKVNSILIIFSQPERINPETVYCYISFFVNQYSYTCPYFFFTVGNFR